MCSKCCASRDEKVLWNLLAVSILGYPYTTLFKRREISRGAPSPLQRCQSAIIILNKTDPQLFIIFLSITFIAFVWTGFAVVNACFGIKVYVDIITIF